MSLTRFFLSNTVAIQQKSSPFNHWLSALSITADFRGWSYISLSVWPSSVEKHLFTTDLILALKAIRCWLLRHRKYSSLWSSVEIKMEERGITLLWSKKKKVEPNGVFFNHSFIHFPYSSSARFQLSNVTGQKVVYAMNSSQAYDGAKNESFYFPKFLSKLREYLGMLNIQHFTNGNR